MLDAMQADPPPLMKTTRASDLEIAHLRLGR